MSIEDSIRDTDARFAEVFNRGDLAAVVALHSADALLLGPDSPAERGGQAVEDGFREMLDAGWKNFELGSVQSVRPVNPTCWAGGCSVGLVKRRSARGATRRAS